MDLQSWLNALEQRTDRRGAYLEFETFVLKLLEKLAIEQGKSFETRLSIFRGKTLPRPVHVNSRGQKAAIDGFAVDGIADLPGPTVVEVNFYRAQQRENLRHVAKERLDFAATVEAKSILLIVADRLTTAAKHRLLPTSSREIVIRIWDADDLTALSDRFATYAQDLIFRLPSLAIGGVVERGLQAAPNAWVERRTEHLARLQKAFRQNDLVLVLGAGVSSGIVPTWATLISRLLVAMIERKIPGSLRLTDEDRTSIAAALKNIHGSSPLLEARYVRAGLEIDFNRTLADLLYSTENQSGKPEMSLLESLVRLCIPKRSGPGVRAVITYNFDDLLEERLKDLGVPHHSIYRDDDVPEQDELGVYHVHGFLPRDASAYRDLASSLLVFSEESYHKLFLEPYTWSNIVQINYLRETTCLMVGLSVTDPNLRRLLDIAARKNRGPKHHVVLKRLLPKEVISVGTGDPLREDIAHGFISAHHELQETAFEELGLNIIWVEDHGEIPELIRKIREV